MEWLYIYTLVEQYKTLDSKEDLVPPFSPFEPFGCFPGKKLSHYLLSIGSCGPRCCRTVNEVTNDSNVDKINAPLEMASPVYDKIRLMACWPMEFASLLADWVISTAILSNGLALEMK